MRTDTEPQHNTLFCVYWSMLRGVGMSLLLSWICLNSFAQLPHPNDTLDNGKKVPINQFLSRFSVFNEGGGAGLYYSLNIGISFIKTDLVTADFTIGGNRVQIGQYRWEEPVRHEFVIPVGITTYIGRRRSRLSVRTGYSPILSFVESSSSEDLDAHAFSYPTDRFYFSLGYAYQSPNGLFFSVDAYCQLFVDFSGEPISNLGNNWYGTPYAGTTLGYRLPSKQRHREWRERGIKRRVLRIEEKTEESYDEVDRIFYNDEPLMVDSAELVEIEAKLAKLKKRHEQYLKQEKRENGRSHMFAEGFGAAGDWSVNYSYTFPVTRSELIALDFRGGVGTDDNTFQVPIHAGIKVMKNYRGTGVFGGVQPVIDWKKGTVGAIYFLEHNVEFHFAYGLTGGVAFYLFFDPELYKYRSTIAPYGGFFLGYRLPKMKKD